MAFSYAKLMVEKSGLPFETVIESKPFRNYGKRRLEEKVRIEEKFTRKPVK